ncbi:DAK2 domain-containing protein [Bacillus sp. WLY-B-L8]|uniref:DAK2 domain-containing protein n=1 Tax=Bacillus multifaciens TaxID=3068506 RepID=UPI00274272BA|nr:DAK2 domain-containing protein [Bacillus sp. WLY-B-L8]MDP7978001.1 DAK2 domain-containing protein [Bacillus sp. WLY-B-L8]HDX9587689.1 DAK2 domain-containing protein [Bacillus pseudomycoides]
MSIQKIDGKRLSQMIIQGANNLTNNVQLVDALNVFPVPDGDTGTNMNLSMTSGAREVKGKPSQHAGKVGASLAKGLLMGARGNSGVILSQLFRGFSKSIEQKEELTTIDFADALEAGVETAYKAVMKPIEGTILTVARETSKHAVTVAKKQRDFVSFMEEVVKEANASLNRTPDLLPVLKQVGVVDSGGKGLVVVYEGFLADLKGETIASNEPTQPSMNEMVRAEHHRSVQSQLSTEDIKYGYCTEFMVKLDEEKMKEHNFSEQKFREEISVYGDSLLVVSDDEIVKVHIHAEHPGDAMNYGQRYGSLIKIKVENMREQHTALLDEPAAMHVEVQHPAEKQPYGIVTVAMGSGIKELFESIGATEVIEGGQTMNPSTEDIVKAIEEANAEKVIILPNNGNIVMAAEQAASVVDQEVIVVRSKTVPQGMAAMLAFNPAGTLEENEAQMNEALAHVKTGQITYAVRDTEIDGVTINKDDFMCIADGKIVSTDVEKITAAKKLLENMLDEDAEILTILQGEDASEEEVDALVTFVEEKFEDVEVEVHNGNQPLYSFIFSVE